MTIKLTSTKADLKNEREGAWITIPELPGVRLKVKSLEAPEYTLARDAALRKAQMTAGDGPLHPDKILEILGEVYADHLLVGWEGFDTEYTSEAAKALLMDPAYRPLHNHVSWAAAQVSRTKVEFVEKTVKNSATPSGTASPGKA